jgi:carbamoyltransferase
LYRAGFNESLGIFYTTFTSFLGFRQVEGEYKVMGMAAYGEPKFDLSSLIRFNFHSGDIESPSGLRHVSRETLTSIDEPVYDEHEIYRLTHVKRPVPGAPFRQEHFDLAASVQLHFENAYLGLIKFYLEKSGAKFLCIAGGCALNALANKKLLEIGLQGIYVMPASSDRGISMGAAMLHSSRSSVPVEPLGTMALGREFDNDDVIKVMEDSGIQYHLVEDPTQTCSEALQRGEVVGWFQGRSEFGPRALGQRSILANGSISGMKDTLNRKIKFRESYRPFAPSFLQGEIDLTQYPTNFEYMTFTIDAPSELKSGLPEAVHFDGTSRVQIVNPVSNPKFATLLSESKKLTGFAGVINTSFNLAGEPIVDSPQDALRTFFSSGLDSLFMENVVVRKNPLNLT